MSQIKKSIIFWVSALSLIVGISFGVEIYMNYRVEQRMREAIIVPVYKEGAITKAKTMRAEELAKIEAQEKATEWQRKIMDQYDLIFLFSGNADEKKVKEAIILNRIHQNKKLAEALQYATEQKVWIIFTDAHHVEVRSSNVDIPIQATDEEIITFLLGSSAKDKVGQ